jgi:hypothetical protein
MVADFELAESSPAVGASANGMIHLDVLYDILCSILGETSEPRTAERASEALGVIKEARTNLVWCPANDA